MQNKKLFFFLLTLAMLGWGASWVNVKVLSLYINEYQMMFLRFAITSITIAPVILYLRKSFQLDKKTALLVLLASITNIFYMKYFFLGTKFGTAGLGGAFVTTLIPINTFIIMALFFKRKTTTKDLLALLLGAFGVLMILGVWTLDISQVLTKYNLYFILASLLWPVLTIISSKATNISPLVFIFYMYLCTTILSGIFFIDFSFVQHIKYDNIFWLNILSISIVGTTFATSIYFIGIERLGTNEVSSFIFLVPFFAIGLSIVFLKESLNAHVVIGTIMTIIAVSLLNNIKMPHYKRKKQNTP
ncbi:DMT family transporter [Sulfurospirillum arcachonense]|uniref:DMT family transporter n=1 Tax=Sulfurospirillum arcachonense TaxID=57666 RepID=UPI00046AA767|nr:DMT family transporter [Sulfurospirillum arcachonense]